MLDGLAGHLKECVLQVAAHSFRATWVGEPIRLNERPLQAFDKTAALRIADGVARNKAIFDIVTPAAMSAETMAEINRIARGEAASFPSDKADSQPGQGQAAV